MEKDQETSFDNNEGVCIEKQTRCGIWGCYPSFLQPLASKKTYVVVFGLIGMVNHAMGAYMVGTLSTMEKRFKIPSKKSGFILCFWDIGTLLSSVTMAYIGSKGHKTRWVALGIYISGIASFAQLLPHVIYGPGEDAIAAAFFTNETHMNKTVDSMSICGLGSTETEDCSEGSLTTVPGNILMMSNLVMGAGTCMYWTLGIAYLDDNVKKNKVAWLLSISVFIRMLGPTFGSLLASYSLNMYIDPSLTPKITPSDPRWMGAWWLGWIVFGFAIMLFASAFALFPRQLPRAAKRETMTFKKLNDVEETTTTSIRDFYGAVLRLIKNPILMYNALSAVCYMFGFMAYWMFLPKYMETQFLKTASEASFITGSVALVCTAAGVMISGAVISKVKPSPRFLAGWNVFVEILDVCGSICFGFIGCKKEDFHGNWNNDGSWNLYQDCNSGCNCGPDVKYEPICAINKTMTYYSPCHAGCTNTSIINGTKFYMNCSCIPDSGMATESVCPADCSNGFFLFLVVLCVIHFFGATGRAGNTIIQFRAVSQKDKSISIGFTEMMLCALAFIPAPIFYGALLDYTCLVWGQICGETGNCWLYHDKSLRYLLNFTCSGCLILAVLLDCGVWYHVKGLQIYDEKRDVQEVIEEENDHHLLREFQLDKPTLNNYSLDS